jgi:hypothetical protein
LVDSGSHADSAVQPQCDRLQQWLESLEIR